jgi:hypothetical protein
LSASSLGIEVVPAVGRRRGRGSVVTAAYPIGTDFRPAPREPLATSLHLNGWWSR